MHREIDVPLSQRLLGEMLPAVLAGEAIDVKLLVTAGAQRDTLAGLTGRASAQAGWPDKPIKWVLSQPPGSGPDNVARLLADNGLLRLPLVRFGNAFTAGPADATWKTWLAAGRD